MASGAGKAMVTQCSCSTCCGKHPWWNLPQGTGTIVRSLRLQVGCENRQAAKIKDVLEEWWGTWMPSTGPRGLSLCSLPHDASRMPLSLSHDAQHALIKPGCPCGFDGYLPQGSLENRKLSVHFRSHSASLWANHHGARAWCQSVPESWLVWYRLRQMVGIDFIC